MGQIVLATTVKGGSSKTTTAINLAVMAGRAGKSVLLYDIDKQQSARLWAAKRFSLDREPRIRCQSAYIFSYDRKEVMEKGKTLVGDLRDEAERHDFVIVDGGGSDNAGMRFALRAADIAVVPVIFSQFDLWSFAELHGIINEIAPARETDLRVVVFPSVVGQHDVKDARAEPIIDPDVYGGYDVPRDVLICQRKVFRDSTPQGLGVVEMRYPSGGYRDPKAVAELRSLYRAVFQDDWVDQIHANEKAA